MRRLVVAALLPAAVITVAAPTAHAFVNCRNTYIEYGAMTRAESTCTGLTGAQRQKAVIRYVDGTGSHWAFGACAPNRVTSYTLYKPNVVEGGTWLC